MKNNPLKDLNNLIDSLKSDYGKKPTHVACFDKETKSLYMPIGKYLSLILKNFIYNKFSKIKVSRRFIFEKLKKISP